MTESIQWVASEADVLGVPAWRARLGALRLLVFPGGRPGGISVHRWEVAVDAAGRGRGPDGRSARSVASGTVDGWGDEARMTAQATAEHVALLYSARIGRGVDPLAARVEALECTQAEIIAAIGQASEERAELVTVRRNSTKPTAADASRRTTVGENRSATSRSRSSASVHARIIDAIGEHSAADDAEPESLAGAVDRLLASYAVTLEQRDDALRAAGHGARRVRAATQRIVGAIGASGPTSLEEAVDRLIEKLTDAEGARDDAQRAAAERARAVTRRIVKVCAVKVGAAGAIDLEDAVERLISQHEAATSRVASLLAHASTIRDAAPYDLTNAPEERVLAWASRQVRLPRVSPATRDKLRALVDAVGTPTLAPIEESEHRIERARALIEALPDGATPELVAEMRRSHAELARVRSLLAISNADVDAGEAVGEIMGAVVRLRERLPEHVRGELEGPVAVIDWARERIALPRITPEAMRSVEKLARLAGWRGVGPAEALLPQAVDLLRSLGEELEEVRRHVGAVEDESTLEAIEGYHTAPGDRSDAAFRAGAPVSSSPKGARRLLWAVCDERGDVECSRRLVAPREIRFERLYIAAPRDWERGAGADFSADLYDEVNAAIAAMALPVASEHVTFAVEELAVTTIARVPRGTGGAPVPLKGMVQEFERATRRLRAHTLRAGDEVEGSWHGRDVIRVSGLAREVRTTQIGGAS